MLGFRPVTPLILTALIGGWFRPVAAGDRGEPVGRRRQPVPGVAAGRDDGVVVRPDAMAELVLPQVLPHVLDRVQPGAVARLSSDCHPRPPVSASNHRPTAAGATRLRARQHVRNSGRWYYVAELSDP